MKVYRVRWRPVSLLPVCKGGDLIYTAPSLDVAVQNAGWTLDHLFRTLRNEFPDAGYEAGYELLLVQEEEKKP